MNDNLLMTLGSLVLLALPLVAPGQVPVKEDWENQPTAPIPHLRSGAETWQFSRGEGAKEGKVAIVEGKGRKKGKALSLQPDGELGGVAYALLTTPSVDTQEVRFAARADGDGGFSLRLFVKGGDRKEILRLNLGEGKASINGDRRGTLSLAQDEEGWSEIALKLDRKASTATLRVGGEEKSMEVPKWEEGKLNFQFQVNFDKARSRPPVLIDDVSWLGEGEPRP